MRGLFLALAACGEDTISNDPSNPDSDPVLDARPDVPIADAGALVDAPGDPPTNDAPVAPDGGVDAASPIDAALTPCEEAAFHSDLAWIEQHVFAVSCALSSCHAGAGASAGLRLEIGRSRDNLVNRASTTQPGWVRVVPGVPASSYLLVAVGTAAGPPPRDGTMPLGAPTLCAPMTAAIERWITAGAP